MSELSPLTVDVPEGSVLINPLFGPQDAHRRLLEKKLGVKLSARQERITVSGGNATALAFGERVVQELLGLLRSGAPLFLQDVERAVALLKADGEAKLEQLHGQGLKLGTDKRTVTPKSPNQARYLDAMAGNDLVLAVGPAGTGKTYLAMAAAVASLRRGDIERIVLTRPAVEAGERLGFLPGSLADKVNPYLRPLYDALFDLVGMETAGKLLSDGTVEVAPLAFMRGRTLNRSFIILDEAQNTTREQMKMFLTRLGQRARAVVTGDMTQVDLPAGQQSGLAHAVELLADIEGIATVRLTPVDVVRHPLVQAIVLAYEKEERR